MPDENPIDPAELEQLQAKVEENMAGWQRAKADYANLEKSWQEKQSQFLEMAKAATALEVLPILNHFSLAVEHIPADQQSLGWVQGIVHIQRQVQQLVEKLGVQQMPEPKMFDPAMHESVSHEESDKPPGTVLKITRPGYTLGGRVIQTAQVVVSSGPPRSGDETADATQPNP